MNLTWERLVLGSRVVIVGNFGLRTKGTMIARALPIARLIAAAGHEPHVVLPPWDSPEDAGTRVDVDGVPVYHTPVPRLPALGLFALAALVLRQVARLRPDVVYAFKPKAFAAAVLLAYVAAKRLGLFGGRIVLDTDDWEGEGGWNERESFRFGWLARLTIAVSERWCIWLADEVTVASQELERRVTLLRGRAPTYLPLSVDAVFDALSVSGRLAARSELGLGDAPVVLAYTRFAEFSPERLARVFAEIESREPAAQFLVVGTGLHGEERNFAAAIDAAGLSGRVKSVGYVDRQALPHLLGAADVAVHLFDDTLLNRTKGHAKLVELLAAGMPVVVDQVGQASEYVTSPDNGVLVRSGDVVAMADEVCALLRSEPERLRMSARAREEVRRRWLWERWSATVLHALSLNSPAERSQAGR